MKTKLLVLFILVMVLLTFAQAVSEEEPSYYLSLYPGSYCYSPGDKCSLQVSLYYYYLKQKGDIDVDLKLEIFDVSESFLDSQDYEKYISQKKPLKTIEKKVTLKNDYSDYWENYFTIDLPDLPSGFYYIKGSTPKVQSTSILKISQIGLTVKSDKEEFLFFVQDRKTGEAAKDAEIKIFKDNKELKTLKTDETGSARLENNLKSGDSVRILAVKGKELAEANISSYDVPEEFKGYIYTDRPIYRPEQKVNLKATLRYQKGGELSYAKDREINVIVKDPQGAEIYNKKNKTDEYGSLSGNLILGKEPPLGYYYIYCSDEKGNSATGSFQVEEYRKPEFEIKLKPDKDTYIQGEKMNIDMDVNYYFGAPVPDTEYTYQVYRNYYYPYYYIYWWEGDLMPYYNGGGQMVENGTGKTDKNGKSKITAKTEKVDYDSNYTITVKMIDKSRREVTSSSLSKVTRGAFYLDFSTERYCCQPKEKVSMKLKALDYSQKPVQTEAEINIRYEIYDEKMKTSTWEDVKKLNLKTDEQGLCYFDVTPEKAGYYEVDCTALDQKENKITTSGYFYCTSESGYYDWYRFSNVEIIPDKNYYRIGDEATILIVCPFDKSKALVTVEGDDIMSKEIMDFPNKTRTIKVKITEKCSPNFFVTVSFYNEGAFHFYNKKIVCPREDKFLTMEIKSDKEKYKPRDTAKFIIETKDYKNKPVSAQVTLGVADESVYAVASDSTPNIQKFFYGTKNSYIYTYSSDGSQYGGPYNYYDYYKDGEVLATNHGGPSPPPEIPQPSVQATPVMVQPEFTRSFFPDTAYFNPGIITDQNGKAEVMVPMPDTLTTWRATGRGVTKETEVGEATEKVIVTKNLLARLITPRFLTERDETVITGIVHNYLKGKKTVRLKLEIDGGVELLEKPQVDIEVPPDGAVPFDWKIKADRVGECKFTLTALTDEESDAVELKVPVLGHGTEKYVALAGMTKDHVEEVLNLPDEATRESASCLIMLDPSLASSMFSSLEYLVGYPYGCTEQTMSRFLPNIIVSKTLGDLDIYNEKINKDLPDMVEKGFKRLYDYHHSDGGWGWWENDESHPFMTAYVVYGLSLAKEAGYKVDQDILNSGIKWLKDNYKKQEDLNTQAYMAFSLTTAGEKTNDWLTELYKKHDKLNSYSRAVLTISLQKSGLLTEAKEMVAILEKSADVTGTSAFWSAKTDAHGWTDNQFETTAYALKAILSVKPESDLIPKIIRFLTGSRKGQYWYSTKDTAAIVMAFTDYMKISKEMYPDFTADIYFNGTKIKSCKFTKEDVGKPGTEISIPYDQGLLAGKNNLKIEFKGKGALYYAAYLKYFTKGENITSESSGISVKKTYYLIKAGETDPEKSRVKLASQGDIKVNCQDIIEVELEVSGTSNYEYMIIEDPKPAGCEVEDEPISGYWNYWYAHREIRDEKVALFSTYFWSDKRTLTYRLRAETPGLFHTMPARAYLMYTPEIGGNSSEIILEIKDSGTRKLNE